MKKLILIAALAVAANAYTVASFTGLFKDKIKPTAEYAIDTDGENARAYEFMTQTQPRQNCVIVYTSNHKAAVMSCTQVKEGN